MKLEATKGPVPVLVIDHAERRSENRCPQVLGAPGSPEVAFTGGMVQPRLVHKTLANIEPRGVANAADWRRIGTVLKTVVLGNHHFHPHLLTQPQYADFAADMLFSDRNS